MPEMPKLETSTQRVVERGRFYPRTRHVWNAFVHGIETGQLYGYYVRGPFDPARGFRFDEHKLLLDPYARAITGKPKNQNNLLLAYDPKSHARDLSFDTRDSTHAMPKAVVIDDRFDWQGDRPPDIALEELDGVRNPVDEAEVEVILDVVYDHTAEGSELGPTVSALELADVVPPYGLERSLRRRRALCV